MDPVSLLLVQAVSPIALGSDVVRSGRPGGVDPLKSVLKGPLSGPSHREVVGVEFAGWSGNASHTISSQVLKHGTVRISGTTRLFLLLEISLSISLASCFHGKHESIGTWDKKKPRYLHYKTQTLKRCPKV